MSDITPEQGAKIVAAAAEWKGTPYKLIGAASVRIQGGDCSGSTWKIYEAAGFPYAYNATATFVSYATRTGKFRELGPKEEKQEGDILYWSGHVAIYSSFANDPANGTTARVRGATKWTQVNDMWSATRPGGAAYGPNNSRYFRKESPRVFRYVQ